VRLPGQAAELPSAVIEAMARVEAALSTAAPPALSEVVRATGCPPEGLRALEASGRIVRLEFEIAYSRSTYGRLAALALRLAADAPLSPAAYRDATGTSRRYALAILEDLDRRGLLRRTPEGHVIGPRAPRPAAVAS
jgi:selenocysteine-specific elongation factor